MNSAPCVPLGQSETLTQAPERGAAHLPGPAGRLRQPAGHLRHSLRLKAWMLAAALLGVAASALAQSSEYSPLKNCPAAKKLRLPSQVVDADAVRCKAPKGWSLYIVEEDPRSYVVLGYGQGQLFSTQTDTQLGLFPNVGESPAEWRVDAAGRPYAFIVRQWFQDEKSPNQDRAMSRLLVYKLQPAPQLVGAFADNVQARAAADKNIK